MALTNIYMHIPTPSFQNYTRLNSTNFNDYVCNHSNVPFLLIQVHKKINKFKWSRDIRMLLVSECTVPVSLCINDPARAASLLPLCLSQSCLRAVG